MVEIHQKRIKGTFYFRVKASNGAVLATSEQYASKYGAKEGITSLFRTLNAKNTEIKDCTT